MEGVRYAYRDDQTGAVLAYGVDDRHQRGLRSLMEGVRYAYRKDQTGAVLALECTPTWPDHVSEITWSCK